MTRKQNFFGQIVLAADLAIIMESYLVTFLVRSRLVRHSPALMPQGSLRVYSWLLPILVPLWLVAMGYFELYNPGTYRSPVKTIVALLKTQVLAGLILFSAMFMLSSWGPSRTMMALFIVISFIGLGGEKLTVHALMKYRGRVRRSTTAWKVLLVGSRADAENYVNLVLQHPHWNTEIVGIVSASPDGAHESNDHGDLHSAIKN